MMRFKKHILLIFLFVGLTTNILDAQVYSQSATRSSENIKTTTHTAKMGETVYSIATAYQTTVDEIYKLNPGSDKGINVGQVVNVPSFVGRNLAEKAQSNTSNEDTLPNRHKITPKETLFSVSQKYNITVGELLKANPGLNESTFSINKEIVIPDVYSPNSQPTKEISFSDYEHKVGKQETLYNISKKYNCSIEDIINANPSIKELGLQEGSTIYVPKKDNNSSSNNDNYALNKINSYPTYYLPEDGVVRVALLLPFMVGSKNVSLEKITEYYEGFLLAIQRMKERGLNAEIYTFDIGNDNDTRRLESILGTNELNSLNLIIGGVSDKQVQLISKFSQRTGIKYVVPFSNKNTGVENNPYMFQVANSHTNQYSKIVRGFITKFSDANIIFLSESGSDKNKMDFVKELQDGLKGANITYKVASTSASITDDLNAVTDSNRRNIIIPTSSSEASLKRVMEAMSVLTRGKINVSLFGYPEWQTYINKTKKLHQYNSYIYGMFYLDTTQPDAQLFSDRYKQWYNKSLVISYPKFAHMGYDTGIVFLTALQKLGDDFPSRINTLDAPTLQSALYFELTNANGGYMNTGMYFVNMKPDGTVEKLEISRQ